jgi:hypothetical protein
VLAFQFGGSSQSGLPTGGDWRCFDVDRIESIALLQGQPWRSGESRGVREQTCVKQVELSYTMRHGNYP